MPKIYYESKKRALMYGLFVFVPLLLIFGFKTSKYINDIAFIRSLTESLIIFLIFFILFLYMYPVGRLEIYQDHFTYSKGKLKVTSKWADVTTIAFQTMYSSSGGSNTPSAFFIDTPSGRTRLIDTLILKLEGSPKQKVDLLVFVQDLKAVSGKNIVWGDTSTKRYSSVDFEDYLKGNR